MINVVNNAIISSQIGKNYLSIDINNDEKDDILMRDANTIYAKYAKQNPEYLSKNGNHLTSHMTRYFPYEGRGNKRRIDNVQELEALTDGYADAGNIKIKLRDSFSEVKNFKTQGQSFDSLQLTRKNSVALGENISGYIIKFTYKVDTFFDKVRTFNFFGTDVTEEKYIVILPQDTSYATGLLSVETIQKKPFKALLTGTVLAIKYFDPTQDTISVTVNDMPRKRLYAQIGSLDQDPSQLTIAQRKSFALYVQGSPWSNQIVAGNQLLGDMQ